MHTCAKSGENWISYNFYNTLPMDVPIARGNQLQKHGTKK
ncbi:hypothetical protein RD1_3955 [Roseobacter denitrificans OCh 114]|uniref:Uncharacterized protein n=1 Tax=Roseobacter denitrificans (strain ATCC 33942 / OCh 114) TaxID=375451 RepID=Q161D4_ROSDO|nr:hypothetical protein RD1_3955 [Roseobacter denitrificans OCh 114]